MTDYKIIEWEVNRIQKIKVFHAKPNGENVTITGRNGQGKSSAMKALFMALGEKNMIPPEPVQQGKESASIKVKIGDSNDYLEVVRHWTTPAKSYLKVFASDGTLLRQPASVLNALVGNLSFDPFKFTQMKPKERLNILKQVSGVNVDPIDLREKELYDQRTSVNRDVDRLEKLSKSIDIDPEEVDFDTTIDGVLDQKRQIDERNGSLEQLRNENIKLKDRQTNIAQAFQNKKQNHKDLIARLDDLKMRIQQATELIESSTLQMISMKEEYDGVKFHENIEENEDTTIFDDQIKEFGQLQELRARANQKIQIATDLEVKIKESQSMTRVIEELRHERTAMIESAKMPIKGLDFGEKDIEFKGIPLSQLCTSEQIKVSMAIAIKTNPKLKTIFIENASLMDDDSFEEIKRIANDNGFQIIMEKVSSKKEDNCIFIEDGEIKE